MGPVKPRRGSATSVRAGIRVFEALQVMFPAGCELALRIKEAKRVLSRAAFTAQFAPILPEGLEHLDNHLLHG